MIKGSFWNCLYKAIRLFSSSDADLKRELTSEALIRLLQKHNGAKNIFFSIHNFDKIL